MIKLMLNLHKFNNYAFFCPVSRLHLTVSSPVGFTNEVTPAISKALKAETILDVDGVVDIETGTVKAVQQTPVASIVEPKKPAEAPAPKGEKSKNENDGDTKQGNAAEIKEKVEETKVEETKVEKTEAKAEEKPAENEKKAKKGGKKTAKAEDAE